MDNNSLINLELERSFQFFWNEANTDPSSEGYGLVIDRLSNKRSASIASVGFALSAYIVGIERGFITYDEGYERVLGTLKTLRDHVPHYKGFFVHFAEMETGKRKGKTEYSTIDTAICLNGALTVDAYFEDETITDYVNTLVKRVDWEHFTFDYNGKKMFRMAYNPDRDGSYSPDDEGWNYQWHMPAEQLMMYFLAAGNEQIDSDLAVQLYFGFERYVGGYNDYQFVYTPGGALFTYQFSHAWFNFKDYVDAKGFDWFLNSRLATLANRQWCIDHHDTFQTLHENAWGLTACDHPFGYAAFGTPPFSWDDTVKRINCNGTIAPYGPISSIIFTPEESMNAMQYFYDTFQDKIFGEYGFKDAYNLDVSPHWFCDDYIGIDKGITLLMLDNYLYGTTQKYYMKHPVIKRAIEVLQFEKK